MVHGLIFVQALFDFVALVVLCSTQVCAMEHEDDDVISSVPLMPQSMKSIVLMMVPEFPVVRHPSSCMQKHKCRECRHRS